ncbi:CdaR family transcriptional regulator [Adlercreutzia sp. ZJ305]|nr:PucR family transcriptional regulator [Adlercreutzia sp. ZJ305]
MGRAEGNARCAAGEQALEDLLCQPPTSENSLPHVTAAMLVDRLASSGMLAAPTASRRTFRWYAPIACAQSAEETPAATCPTCPACSPCAAPARVSESQLLFVCDAASARELLAKRPAAFALLQLDDASRLADFAPYRERTIVLERRCSLTHLLFLLQSFFVRILIWESDLERIMLRQGTLTDMLDASASVIGNFIFVSDNNFNVIARTTAVEPPDELHRTIIDNGCLTPDTIAEKRFRLPEKTFYTRAASEITPFDRVSHPIHINHSYFGSISMACNAMPDTEGMRDLFLTLVRRMTPLCEKIWSHEAQLNTPSYFFFSKLLEHAPLSEAYVSAQMDMAGLADAGHFKLVACDVDEGADPKRARLVAKAASTLNDGNVRCFPHQSHVLALLYSGGADGKLAHSRTLDELRRKVFEPYDVISGVSSVFKNITDLDLAFRQTQIALGFRGAILQEQFADTSSHARGAYLFEDALLYYLIDPTAHDQRFVQFAFQCSIASILHQEDLENGTNHLALMWFYLQSERNATAVAQRMHMHRNTVLYHVEKIQRRFCFDLSSKTARDWMLLSFKYLFLTLSNESLSQIFGEAATGERPEDRRKGAGAQASNPQPTTMEDLTK